MEGSAGIVWGLIVVNFLVLAYLAYGMAKLKQRFRAAFANLDSEQDLATTITSYFSKINVTEQTLASLNQNYSHMAAISNQTLQKIGVVRFNPFSDTGGDQSFALAMLDGNDSGLVLTSIHGREGTRIYIKPIAFGTSQYQLSKEEADALKAAQKSGQRTNRPAKPAAK